VSIVGFDDIVLAGLVQPGLSTIRQPVRLMAKDAVNRLVGCLHPDADAGPVVPGDFKPELVVRASTGPAPASGNARDAADYSAGCDSG
jgi:DNA-binding LacI/PurR family transcriptional regulator